MIKYKKDLSLTQAASYAGHTSEHRSVTLPDALS